MVLTDIAGAWRVEHIVEYGTCMVLLTNVRCGYLSAIFCLLTSTVHDFNLCQNVDYCVTELASPNSHAHHLNESRSTGCKIYVCEKLRQISHAVKDKSYMDHKNHISENKT